MRKKVPELRQHQRVQEINPDGTVGRLGDVWQVLSSQFTIFFDDGDYQFYLKNDFGVTWRLPDA